MRAFVGITACASIALIGLLGTARVRAQEAELEAPAEEVPEAPVEAVTVPEPPVEDVEELEVEELEETEIEEAEIEAEEPEDDEEAEVEEEGALPDWLDGLTISAFADAYAQGIWTLPDPFNGDRSDVLPQRPYTHIAGFTLSFLGLDLSYEHEHVGAVINVRFGTGAPRLLGPTSGLPDGMQFLKQLYVYWRPLDNFQIDFGQFDTIYGAEVSESWRNHNYSRGALYQLVQPFYHTGFRASWSPIEQFTITALAVNGWNNVVDNNDGKTFGIQGTWSSDNLRISAGYLTGPETERELLWRHLADVVITLTIDDLELLANADYIAEDQGDGTYDQLWGAMVSGRLRFPPLFALALRGEIVADPEDETQLYTGTFTIEATPDEHFVIRLENIVEVSSDDRFQDPEGSPSETVLSTILGLVVHSN